MGNVPRPDDGDRRSLVQRGISRKEAEVLAGLGEHLTNAEIAARQFVSVRTIESQVSSLLRKLDAANRRELAVMAPSLLDGHVDTGRRRPTGTVTFLFTDIVGSTELWDRETAAMRAAVERHDDVVRAVVEQHHGHLFATGGDGFGAVFARAADAVRAAGDVQAAVLAESWQLSSPFQVRVGVHTGEAHERGGDYFGPAVSCAARVARAAAGSQVLLTSTTADLLGDLTDPPPLRVIGERRLRGLRHPQRLHELLYVQRPAALDSVRTFTSNVPAPSSGLIGRDGDTALVLAALDDHRLVTIVGPGGVGKTTLGETVAQEVASRFHGGTWLVALAPLTDGGAVDAAFASALGVEPRPGMSMTESIVSSYVEQHALVIVDNCEHVIEEASRVVSALLRGCRELTVLATSREPLAVHGERRVDLLPLGVPAMDATPNETASSPAVRLLRERAAEAGRDLRIDESQAPVLAALCRALGGIPLAIELAASQLRALAPGEVLDRLSANRDSLTDRRRDSPDRHRTLGRTIDWSLQLLSNEERQAFARVSVFAGGFTLDAAEAVCGGDDGDGADMAELLWRLVDRSMILASEDSGGTRYGVLEPLRQHAWELLSEPERLRLAGRHLSYYRALAERAAPGIRGRDETGWVAELTGELQNLRVAVQHAVRTSRLDDAARMVSALHDYAIWRQRFEVGDWAHAVLELPGADQHPTAPTLFATAGWGRCIAGDFDAAIDLAKRGLAVESHSLSCGWLHDVLAHADYFRARDGRSHSHDEIERARADGDRYRLAYVLADSAMHEYMAGALEEGRALADEAVELAEASGCPSILGMAYAARSMSLLDVDPAAARVAARRAARIGASVDAGWVKSVVAVWLLLLAREDDDRSEDLRVTRDALVTYRRAGDEVRVRNVVQSCLPALLVSLSEDDLPELARLHGSSLDRPMMKAAFIDERVEPALGELERRLAGRFNLEVDAGRALTTWDAAARTLDLLDRLLDAHSPPAP